MVLATEDKKQIIDDYRTADNDTGSPEVQVAILTNRINYLTEHMKTHKKDFASQRGLLRMVSRRRRLLDYVKRHNPEQYIELLKRLEIRK